MPELKAQPYEYSHFKEKMCSVLWGRKNEIIRRTPGTYNTSIFLRTWYELRVM